MSGGDAITSYKSANRWTAGPVCGDILDHVHVGVFHGRTVHLQLCYWWPNPAISHWKLDHLQMFFFVFFGKQNRLFFTGCLDHLHASIVLHQWGYHILPNGVITMGITEYSTKLNLYIYYFCTCCWKIVGWNSNANEIVLADLIRLTASLVRYRWYRSTCCNHMDFPVVLTIFHSSFLWIASEVPYLQTIHGDAGTLGHFLGCGPKDYQTWSNICCTRRANPSGDTC